MPQKKGSKTALILHFLRGHKRFFVLCILCSLFVIGLEMLPPQIIRVTIDSILGDAPCQYPFVDVVYLRAHLWVIAIVTAVTALFCALFRYLVGLFNAIGAEGLIMTMRNDLFSYIQRLPFSWHMKHQTGDIIQRCTSDVEMVKNFVSDQLTNLVRILILVTVSLTFMFSMNVKLSLIALASIPIVVGYSVVFHAKIGELFMQVDTNEGILSTIAQENLTGVRVVRAFGREKYEIDRFEKQNKYYTGLWVKLSIFFTVFFGAGDVMGGIQILLILSLGSLFCVRGQMSAGEFIAFISYNAMLIWPVRQLGRMVSEMSKAGVSIERIRDIMSAQAEKDKENATTPDLSGDIAFEHVSYAYGNGTEILHDVSFTIPSGSTFGILGGTGSGKSTLMHLMNRLYDLPKENGRITIGGVDIADMKGEWVRENIGMVLQEPFLFSRTIAENIGITQEEQSLSDIREAARIACVDETVTEFTNGYDTIVGERGVTLSGGQKQRTAIAQTLLRKTPIMVFDDSLSAVDAQTDTHIRAELKKSLTKTTVVLISHRVTTLMQADKILVLDKGCVKEIGTPKELLKQNGIFRRIYDMQMTTPEELKENEAE